MRSIKPILQKISPEPKKLFSKFWKLPLPGVIKNNEKFIAHHHLFQIPPTVLQIFVLILLYQLKLYFLSIFQFLTIFGQFDPYFLNPRIVGTLINTFSRINREPEIIERWLSPFWKEGILWNQMSLISRNSVFTYILP